MLGEHHRGVAEQSLEPALQGVERLVVEAHPPERFRIRERLAEVVGRVGGRLRLIREGVILVRVIVFDVGAGIAVGICVAVSDAVR